MLDITLYRDDLTDIAEEAQIGDTDVPFSVKDKVLILVDDVIYTARTARCALGGGDEAWAAPPGVSGGSYRPRAQRAADPRGFCREKYSDGEKRGGARSNLTM